MKRSQRFFRKDVWAGFGLAAIVGCAGTVPATAPTPDPPTGSELFAMITGVDSYEDWAQFPDAQGIVSSEAPHGPMARTFINAQVVAALSTFSGALPDGAVIVKENIGESASDKANALTVMWKVEGYDDAHNDWFWANLTPEGGINAEGRIDACMNCHSAARSNDFVFVHRFRSAPAE